MAEVYAERKLPCGCLGVPDGQHVPGCASNQTPDATRCRGCGLRTATVVNKDGAKLCGGCGNPKGCARDSDWCDGKVCRERGYDCPYADPVNA